MAEERVATKVLFPLDGSLMAEQAVLYLRGILPGAAVNLRLLTVLPTQENRAKTLDGWRVLLAGLQIGQPPHVTFVDDHQAQTYLDRLAARLRPLGAQVETETRSGEPVAEILAVIERDQTDLVAITTHGRSGLRTMPGERSQEGSRKSLFGSVAEGILRAGRCPVVVVPTSRDMRLLTPQGDLHVILDCTAEELASWELAEGLGIFWEGDRAQQKQALLDVAATPGGRVVVARYGCTVVGWLAITRPDENQRWGRDHIPGLLEMSGIEVSRDYRSAGLARAMLNAVFSDRTLDDKIVFGQGFQWHWDLEGIGLTAERYRDTLVRLFGDHGFQVYDTDEPNVKNYPPNLFVARIGTQANDHLIEQFTWLLEDKRLA